MAYDLSVLWAWLPAAWMIGGAVGWATSANRPRRRRVFGWLGFALFALVVGVVAAWRHWLPGRAGFWLETALWFFASYIVGCLLGGFLQSAISAASCGTPATASTRSDGARAGRRFIGTGRSGPDGRR
jgi:hypothetical protein